MAEQVRTVCNRDCPDACGIIATVEDGRVTKLAGDPEHPITRGSLCFRTSRFLQRQYSPDRLTAPLRRKNGVLTPVGWDEALDFAAERLLAIREESGPAAILHYRSGGSLGALKLLTDYLFEQLGPVTIKRGDICSGAGDYAQMVDFGEEDSNDLFDLVHARQVILWGKNVVTSSPHTLPVLKEARARGAELLLIDPVRHKTADHCDRYLSVRPGGDFALAMAVARILFERGWIDPAAPTYCDHLDAFRALAESQTLEGWCEAADVAPAAAVDLARRLGVEKPAAILVGWGMGRRTNGAAIVRALDALSAITGNLGRSGGGVSFYYKRRGAFDLSFVKGEEVAPRTVCEPRLGPEILAAKDPPIRAVWITAANPVVMLPESETTARALETRELVVVADSFLTDTAERAHLVLPTATLLEDDDLLGAYGHHFIGASRPVVPRPPGVRTDLEIAQELAERLGLGSLLAGDARAWKERIIRTKLGPHGVTVADLETRAVKNPLVPPVIFADRRFKTASGRVNLICEAPPEAGRPKAPYPLFLLALSTKESQCSQWAVAADGPPIATVHPEGAGGFADGAVARLESRVSSMVVKLRHDPEQRRDLVIVPKGGHLRAGRCANALIRAQTTDHGEGGALHDEHVRLTPI
ncbi:MAG: molybdopterin-dependent oxidoreductase [Deltaproteobacteria bacterium]|nr:molybdopterin-dependent oxidoreductase [Deltaproteobacteria bacterium]